MDVETLQKLNEACLALWGIAASDAVLIPTKSHRIIIPHYSPPGLDDWEAHWDADSISYKQIEIELIHHIDSVSQFDVWIGHAEMEGKHIIAYKL